MYNTTDLINYPGRIITAAEKWQEDIDKEDFALTNGYRTIVLRDKEIETINTCEELKQLLLKK